MSAAAPRPHGIALAAALLVAWPLGAGALGPTAPFTPPRASATSMPLTDSTSALATRVGLAGLRLGPHPLALLDGEWRQPGDSVRGARLTQLDSRGVTLMHPDGKRERLWLAAPPAEANPAATATAQRTQPTGTLR